MLVSYVAGIVDGRTDDYYYAGFANVFSTSYTYTGDSGYAYAQLNYETAPVPEPATMLLLGSGLVGLTGFRKRFLKK